jgi:outer membrane protein TolC
MSESILSPYSDMQRCAPFVQRALIMLFSATLAACAAGPDFKQPEAPKVARFTEKPTATTLATAPNVAGGTEQQIIPDTDIPAEWWTLFKSPELDKLIKTALEQNPNLAAADAALRVAQENVNAQIGGQYFPSIGFGANTSRQQQSLATFGIPNQNIYNVYNTSINLGYRLDVFGAARRAVESARAQAEISQFQLEGAYLALTANIVTAAVREAALRAQYAATSEVLKAQQNFADVTARQLEIGTVSRVDLT